MALKNDIYTMGISVSFILANLKMILVIPSQVAKDKLIGLNCRVFLNTIDQVQLEPLSSEMKHSGVLPYRPLSNFILITFHSSGFYMYIRGQNIIKTY